MTIPSVGKIYSMNEGNFFKSSVGIQNFIKYAQQIDPASNRPYTGRYIGSLVADFHRNLIKGGVYLYPATTTAPKGKLRLLYECSPMALIMEQAGGKATDGVQRILEIDPTELHQRVPFFAGTTHMVNKIEELIREETK
jgi:fructose-1,6-bisphosphatase I